MTDLDPSSCSCLVLYPIVPRLKPLFPEFPVPMFPLIRPDFSGHLLSAVPPCLGLPSLFTFFPAFPYYQARHAGEKNLTHFGPSNLIEMNRPPTVPFPQANG